MFTPEHKEKCNEIPYAIIGAAIEVHRHLGPGLLESAYQTCLEYELYVRGIPFKKQVELPTEYKGIRLASVYRMDLVFCDSVVVEVKSIDAIDPIHESQLLTYLKLFQRWLGLLVNFNVCILKEGVRRLANG